MIAILILLAVAGLMHAARSFSPDAVSPELAFGFLLLAAYFSSKVVARIGLPKLTGYIAAGIVFGPYALGLVSTGMTAQLKVVSGVAVSILALTAGCELNVREIRPFAQLLRSVALWAGLGAILLLTGVLMALRPLLPFLADMPVLHSLAVSATIAVAVSAQSPAVVMALLAETRADGPIARMMLASVVVADLMVIVLYSVASTVASSIISGEVDIGGAAGGVLWELLGSAGFGIAMGALLALFLRHVERGSSMFAIVICVVVAEIGTRIHLDPLVVMLTAGLWLVNVARVNPHQLLHDFEDAQLPVFLVFFALAGTKLDIGAMGAVAVPVVILAAARAIAFFIGVKVAYRRSGGSPQESRVVWFGLLPQAGLALALALLVQRTFPEFGDEVAVILFGVVGVNELLAPVLLKWRLMRSGEAGNRPAPEEPPSH